jgi:hypothetical protein
MDWVEIPEFPKYSVNALGQIRHTRFEREIRPQVNQYGVPYVCVYDRYGVQAKRSLALIVAQAFIPERSPEFDTPINLDGDRLNCDTDNLMWRPRWFARRYHQQFRDPYPRPIDVPLRDLAGGHAFHNSYEVFTTFGLLERDLVLSIENRTYVWPTYQMFGYA